MSEVAHRPPEVDGARLAAELFGVQGTATALPSERDRNYEISAADGARYVLKVANAAERASFLACQQRALQRLRERASHGRFPTPAPSIGGAEGPVELELDGAIHRVRLVRHVSGVPLADYRPHRPALLQELGRVVGGLNVALGDFDHPDLHRDFAWELSGCAPHLERGAATIADTDAPLAERLRAFAEAFREHVVPRLADVPQGAIHGDANDYNVIVDVAGPDTEPAVGLIDFGDMIHSCVVADLAVAIAYAMLGKRDPLAAAAHLVRGYVAVRPLTDGEADVVWDLALARLHLSMAMAIQQRAAAPDNDAYLSISQQAIRELLPRLDAVHPRLARYALRDAAGLPPCPAGAAVARWLAEHGAGAAPVVEPDPRTARTLVLDLSVGSLEIGPCDRVSVDALTRRIEARLREAGAELGLGRYDEARVLYASDGFAADGEERSAPRTVHLGVDLFAPAGTPVLAPFDGEVWSVADNDAPLDYGPTLILQHEPAPNVRFWTLYGHLDPEVLERLAAGQRVGRGERVAAIGAPPRNGGWPPHLHLQVVADPLDQRGDVPGVAAPQWRAVWRSICPDPSPLLGLPVGGAAMPPPPPLPALQDARRSRLGPSLSVSYRAPLHIVRGEGARLFDIDGLDYLDVVNNVCHVGHAHPRVVAAATAQMAVLNTNTRYLHETILRYADRLRGWFPAPLEVCFFVNSGSEANELALRLARTHTGRADLVVLDGAYHGHSQALIDASSYKHAGPGGDGPPPHVHVAPMPDPYRGRHRGPGDGVGTAYAAEVAEIVQRLEATDRPPGAFLSESLLGCGGQIVLPPGYLAAVYAAVRAAGGLCIADEVQVGFGRVGTHRWGFETQGVVPDVVTLGKPIGNGHPLAAVLTTAEIATSFANGMEYFNTFGGNPVSCAVGLAVLDVIEDEGLQERARVVGAELRAGLEELAARYPLIGDVRGLGLFLGIELVLDERLSPAPAHATYVVERMRERGVLLSTDGPEHNVIKIKPPLAFASADARQMLEGLRAVFDETPLR
ncbi:MAG: aminotransferase class III-fold pyridoxal phosphate-dependent enzyme [Planctomycetota bacterium]